MNKTLTEQRLAVASKILRRLVVNANDVWDITGLSVEKLDEIMPDLLKPVLHRALYLSPSGVRPLINELEEAKMINERIEFEKVNSISDNEKELQDEGQNKESPTDSE